MAVTDAQALLYLYTDTKLVADFLTRSAIIMAASGTARFLMPRASNYNGHPLQKLQTLKYHIYLLNFHLLVTVI